MRAATYMLEGPDAGQIVVRDLDDPVAGPGEVLVRIALAGVNPTDWKARTASLQRLDAPFVIPGQDGAGTVEAVGDGVDPGRVGERVWLWEGQWGRAHGTAAELIALPAERAVPLPDAAPFELGASLGIPVMTAHRCLTAGRDGLALPGAEDRVLVTGGAGAVGRAAIELARFAGAPVAATVSGPEKAQIARAAGADPVVDYRREDVAAAIRAWAPDGVGRIVEVGINANLATAAAVLAPGGTVAAYAVTGEPAVIDRPLMASNAVLRFVLIYTVPAEAKAAAVATIEAALAAGALTAPTIHRFPLAETAAAHDAVRAGAVGKVVIDPAG